jgi:hypothetical protein
MLPHSYLNATASANPTAAPFAVHYRGSPPPLSPAAGLAIPDPRSYPS